MIEREALVKQSNKVMLLRSQQAATSQDVLAWLNQGKHFGLKLRAIQWICVDIDNLALASIVLHLLNQSKISSLITTSPRGGHFFFSYPSEISTDIFLKRAVQNMVVVAGFMIECRVESVTFIGRGYDVIFHTMSPEPLPWFLWPANLGARGQRKPHLTEENQYAIREGERNKTLYKMTMQLFSDKPEELDSSFVFKALHFFNHHFCVPPLPNSELQTIFDSALSGHESQKESASEKLQSSELFFAFEKKFLKTLYCTTKPTQWFLWRDGYWSEVKEVVIQRMIMEEITSLNPSALKASLINEVLSLLEKRFADENVQDAQPGEDFSIEGKINFKNGVLDTKTLQLTNHDPKYRFFSVLPIEYNENDYPDEQLRAVLLNFVNGDRERLELLRGLVRRALEPAPQLQTGFWIYGPPGTGKSTFVNWLKGVVGSQAIEMVVKSMTLFTTARLKGKSLVMISDGDSVNSECINLTKKLLGRDDIPFDWKHEMLTTASFVSSAVMVVTSNLNVANAMVGVYDEGFIDRLIEIHFSFVPEKPQVALKAYLDGQTSALVNWAFNASKSFLQSQVRAGTWSYASHLNNPYIDFISTYLVVEEKQFISNAETLELFDEFLKFNGTPALSPSARRKAPGVIFNLIRRTFQVEVKRGRESGRGARGLCNIRRRKKTDPKESWLVPAISGGPKLTCDDPFFKHGVTPYTELGQDFQVSARKALDESVIEVSLTNQGMEERDQEDPLLNIEVIRSAIPVKNNASDQEILDLSFERWWRFDLRCPQDITPFNPWEPYPYSERFQASCERALKMPKLWPELISLVERWQPPHVRDKIYQEIASKQTRERSWYSSKRQPGVLGFIFPSGYRRTRNQYPRLQPLGEGNNQLGILGAEKSFRQAVMADLNQHFNVLGLTLVEVDLESCHTQILVDLKLGATNITRMFQAGENIWENIIGKLPMEIAEQIDFKFLKGCVKRICYKALQGGRIDTAEKIRTSLHQEEAVIKRSLENLSKSLSENEILLEFDLLNKELMRRYKTKDLLRVYTPINAEPFTLRRTQGTDGYTENPCRVASQIVTGIEMLQILLLLEQIQKLKVKWIPVSLHHDGCALLVEAATFEDNKQAVVNGMNDRLAATGMNIKGLEFTHYPNNL